MEKFNRIQRKNKKKSQVLFESENESKRKIIARKDKLKKLSLKARNQERPPGFGKNFDLKKFLNDYDIVDVHNVELPPYILLKLSEGSWSKEQDFKEDFDWKNRMLKVYRESQNGIKRRELKYMKDASAQISDSDFKKVREFFLREPRDLIQK